ncbi:MAG: site-specific DNA-methyltransferase [candidate division Zixibacteria bacterium]|nr:site-specific DNA-methyltransferase [candidate division Zixibacteria bacterium]
MINTPFPRLDLDSGAVRKQLLSLCRLERGQIWQDPEGRHVVGCGDAGDAGFIKKIFKGVKPPALAVFDPPYNLAVFERQTVNEYIEWCRRWVDSCYRLLNDNAAFYVWLGADQKEHFQPLPQFMMMMAASGFKARSFITMRNQRGYGTQKNWMAIRQELLYYVKGEPIFNVQYTDIPKILRGYYKEVNGHVTENMERSHSPNIRPGNVWVDIQQVFYRMEENVNGCYAQKPLKAIERIIMASSSEGDTVTDFFAHSGTTLLACEQTNRKCVTFDIDPVFAEITIRRLEHYRMTGKTGWQNSHPFEQELEKKEADTVT